MSELVHVESSIDGMRAALARDPEIVVEQPAQYECPVCNDLGMVLTENNGRRWARACECRKRKAQARRMQNACIPVRYATADFGNFNPQGMDPSIAIAHRMLERVVSDYLMHPEGQGVLLTGTCGTGKTHLAVAALKEVLGRYGATGKFWDMGDLLTQLKRTFNRLDRSRDGDPIETEAAMIDECTNVDVLVLDELGGERLTDWSYSEVSLLLNARYNGQGDKPRLTIFTTNFKNAAPGEVRGEETLGDRIGARMYSRLQEMCRVVEMTGKDFRIRR